MPKQNCPECGALAVRVSLKRGYNLYCSQCPWNREIARAALLFQIRTSLVVAALGVILAVVVSVEKPSEKGFARAMLLAVSGLPLFYVMAGRHQLRKWKQLSLQSTSHRIGASVLSQTTPLRGNDSKGISFHEKGFPELEAIPRPRKLKTTWKSRGYWVFALLGVALYTIYAFPIAWRELRIPHSWNENDLILLVLAAMVYGWFFFFLRNRIRERQLLADGELATGYVTAQRNGRNMHSIDYRFRRADGAIITARCNDASRSLFEGMPVAVFYDAQDPQRSVPLEASMTTIADL